MRELAFALGAAPDSETLLAAADSFLAPRAGRPAGSAALHHPQPASRRAANHASSRNDPPRAQLVLSQAQADDGIARVEAQRGFALSDEQRELVRGVIADAGSVSLVRAVAGSGKTTTLAAIAQAYASAGIPVHGVAPTGAAARVMTRGRHPSRAPSIARCSTASRRYAPASDQRPGSCSSTRPARSARTHSRDSHKPSHSPTPSSCWSATTRSSHPCPPAPATPTSSTAQRPVHSLETPRRFITPNGEPDLAEARALASLRAGTLEGAAAYLDHKQRHRHGQDA